MGNIDLLEDACARPPHTTRRMFGGHGLFAPNGGMFAGIVTDDEIVLKFADEAARKELEALGGHAWVYDNKMTMREWIVVPDRFYDEPDALAAWARRAHQLVPGKAVKAGKAAAKKASAKPASKGVPGARAGAAKPARKAARERAKPPASRGKAPARRTKRS